MAVAESFSSSPRSVIVTVLSTGSIPVVVTSYAGGAATDGEPVPGLIAGPSITLLDEATAQVDGVTEAAIHQVIADRARDATVHAIAHRLSTVIDADETIVMNRGSIEARGTHAELGLQCPVPATRRSTAHRYGCRVGDLRASRGETGSGRTAAQSGERPTAVVLSTCV